MSVLENMVEVKLRNDEDFLKVRETLTRIGIASPANNTLYQSCHILHKRGKFYIVHFKELFLLDGKKSNFTEDDIARRNTIVNLLEQWDLIDIVEPKKIKNPVTEVSKIKILPYKEKNNWILTPKYAIGKKYISNYNGDFDDTDI